MMNFIIIIFINVIIMMMYNYYCRRCNSSALLKQEFFNKWIKGLRIYTNLNKEMTVSERKKAIKLSADVAIASTRNVSTHWSQALMAEVSGDGAAAKVVVEEISGRKAVTRKKAPTMTCSKKIVRRSHVRRVVRSSNVKATCIAKKLVRNRTRVLKRLVPGGEEMDEVSLIKETLDYIASLQVQVDVMRQLVAVGQT